MDALDQWINYGVQSIDRDVCWPCGEIDYIVAVPGGSCGVAHVWATCPKCEKRWLRPAGRKQLIPAQIRESR